MGAILRDGIECEESREKKNKLDLTEHTICLKGYRQL
jgi:hypothetical protein